MRSSVRWTALFNSSRHSHYCKHFTLLQNRFCFKAT